MSDVRRARGAAARVSGRRGEIVEALCLMAKGYRILGFRLGAKQGEIDLLALRQGVLAVVEVKRRRTLEAALEAVRPSQRERLRRAAAQIASRRPALRNVAGRLMQPGQRGYAPDVCRARMPYQC